MAIAFILALVSNSCKHKTVNNPELRQICFTSEILPIFQSGCTMSGCHGESDKGDYELSLNDYKGILKNVSPGDPGNSWAYQAITNKWGEIMPPKPYNPLSEIQRSLISAWISQGAKETTCAIP